MGIIIVFSTSLFTMQFDKPSFSQLIPDLKKKKKVDSWTDPIPEQIIPGPPFVNAWLPKWAHF